MSARQAAPGFGSWLSDNEPMLLEAAAGRAGDRLRACPAKISTLGRLRATLGALSEPSASANDEPWRSAVVGDHRTPNMTGRARRGAESARRVAAAARPVATPVRLRLPEHGFRSPDAARCWFL